MVLKGLEQLVEEAAMQAFEPNITTSSDEKKFASFRKAAERSVICVHVKLDGINIAVPVINQNQSLAHLAKVSEFEYFIVPCGCSLWIYICAHAMAKVQPQSATYSCLNS